MSIDRKAPLSRLVGAVAAFAMAFALAACDDDESSFVRPGDDSSSSVCEDCDESSSSVILSGDSHEGSCSSSEKSSSSRENDKSSSSEKIKSSSSNKVVSSSSEKQASSSSSSVKQSSSSIASSSSSVKSSSSSVKSSSSVVSSSSKDVASSSSIYVPFDHSKTLGYQKFDEDGYKTFTDPRNGRSYYYITITGHPLTGTGNVSVTVMAENLNIGVDVSGDQDQNDDTKIERYCYNNDTTKCDEFGGLYQWAEMMQLPSRCNTESCADLIQENHQGICPDGWRLFTYEDYIVVLTAEGNDDGVKGMRSTYGFSGTNHSGFSLTGAGKRTKKGGFERLKKVAYWFYPQEHEYNERLYVHNGYIAADLADAPQANDGDEKVFGFSVRCTKLEE